MLDMGNNKSTHNKIPYGKWLLIHCPSCSYEWEPVYRLWWKFWVNVLLFVLWIIPWILYLIRRIMNPVCLCPDCKCEDLWEINWDDELIKKLKKIIFFQNICYILLVLLFFLFVGYELYLAYNNIP